MISLARGHSHLTANNPFRIILRDIRVTGVLGATFLLTIHAYRTHLVPNAAVITIHIDNLQPAPPTQECLQPLHFGSGPKTQHRIH